jgi:hypothetical protein
MKIRPVGAELFHADGQADRHEKAFRHFAKVAKTNQLMLYREIIAVCSEICKKNTVGRTRNL